MALKTYEYERIKTSTDNQRILKEQGYTPFFSSNVSAGQRDGNDLYIRFHNGSVYRYKGSGDMFESLLFSSSKGKWVWANLRKPKKPYARVGDFPLTGDRDLTDDELFAEVAKALVLITKVATITATDISLIGATVGLLVKGINTIEQVGLKALESQII